MAAGDPGVPGSSRFAVALHALCLLAHEGRALTSAVIAESVNTHPSLIRRLLRRLAKAGLVRTTDGGVGGTRLARPPSRITLAQVYRAVEGEVRLFHTPRAVPNPLCPVGGRIRSVLKGRLHRFQTATAWEMAKVSLADVLADIRRGRAPDARQASPMRGQAADEA